MAGHSDESHKSFVTRCGQRFDGAARGKGFIPFLWLHQVVELDEVDAIDAEAGQRLFELASGRSTTALTGFGGQKYFVAMRFQPRGKAQLGVAVSRCRIDVIETRCKNLGKNAVSHFLAATSQRCGAKDHPRAQMSGTAKNESFDHLGSLGSATKFADEMGTGEHRGVARWIVRRRAGGQACHFAVEVGVMKERHALPAAAQ